MSTIERVLLLRRVPPFSALPPRDLGALAAVTSEHRYGDGAVLARQGEPGHELHVVVSGAVRVLTRGPGGDVEVARRAAGEIVGEMALVTREPRSATLVAAGDVRTLRLGRAEFDSVLRERPETAIEVIQLLSRRLAHLTGGGQLNRASAARQAVGSERGS